MTLTRTLKNDNNAVSTLLAVLVVVLLAVSAVGVYVVVSNDDGDEKEKRTVIQGSMGMMTEFKYDLESDIGLGETNYVQIVGQNEDHYLVIIGVSVYYEELSRSYSFFTTFTFLMHKTTGDLEFAEYKGLSGTDGAKEWYILASDVRTDGVIDESYALTVITDVVDGNPVPIGFTAKVVKPDLSFEVSGVYTETVPVEPEEYIPSEKLWSEYRYDLVEIDNGKEKLATATLLTVADSDGATFDLNRTNATNIIDGKEEAIVVNMIQPSVEYLYGSGALETETVTIDTCDGMVTLTLYSDDYNTGTGHGIDRAYMTDSGILYKFEIEEYDLDGELVRQSSRTLVEWSRP